jgi:hypothetical protein
VTRRPAGADPRSRTNEIGGELQQGGEARRLYGWVDVDKLADPAATVTKS